MMDADQELLQCKGRIDTSTLPKASANRIAQNYGMHDTTSTLQ